MKILAIAVAVFAMCAAEVAIACPACNARVGQSLVVPASTASYARPVQYVRRPMAHHHHARRNTVVPTMASMSSGCSSCGISPYISRPCSGGCGAPMSYGYSGCGTGGCGSSGYSLASTGGCATGGCGSTSRAMRYCVRVPGPCGQTVLRCYRLVPVPRGTPGALPYQQIISSYPFASSSGMSGYGSGLGMGGYGIGSYGMGSYGMGSYSMGSYGSGYGMGGTGIFGSSSYGAGGYGMSY